MLQLQIYICYNTRMGALFAQEKQPLLFHIGIPEQSPTNLIKTTSYNLITFLPLATLVQFKRLANVYFLATAVLQFIPAISPLSPFSAIAPLIFVLTISLIRTAVEEIGKYKYDREANSNKFMVYSLSKAQPSSQQSSHESEAGQQQQIPMWTLKRSDELHIGDIIKIQSDERCPADIILLSTSNVDGKVYIETSSLDGEKNLKIRNPLPSTQQMYCTLETIYFIGTNNPLVTVQEPSEQLYSFNALLQCTKKVEKPIYGQRNKKTQKVSEFFKINQLLYRESVLRNTKEAVGVIAYVGKFTKSMMNSTGSKDKMSKLERKVNFYMIFIFSLQFSLILLCGLFQVFLYYRTVVGQAFILIVLKQEQKSSIVQGIITSCSYFILLNTMIPISLLVSIEIVKFGQGAFIAYDKLMTRNDPKLGLISSKAFRSSINEQLGMVQYIFTDKTGTLTKNQMVLKQVIAGSKTYSNQMIQKEGQKQCYFNYELRQDAFKDVREVHKVLKNFAQSMEQSSDPQQYGQLSKSSSNIQKQAVSLMILAMSICHECLLVAGKTSSDSDQYHGSSPDEITLVDSAARLGYKFIDNCYAKIRVKIGQGDYLQIMVEDTFQFNSDRKRMSMVLSVPQLPGYKLLFCKGADSVIDKLLRPEYKTEKDCEQFRSYEAIKQKITSYSRVGLRTLLFGFKLIPNNVYKSVRHQLIEAGEPKMKEGSASGSKQQLVKSLEEGLFLCGATAVEDKLQDEVENVIEDIIKANIKICMLTGDKLETAENIGKSCRLLQQSWKIVRISEGSGEVDVFRGYCQVKDYIEASQKYGVLIEGTAIAIALKSIYFTQILQNCSAAICCRITPKNKAEVVNFAKKNLNKLVLAIGDGANDVPMIQAAHIGIGLYGNQGMNAVQASDFAIPSFKCLWRLLFVHGRWNYLRIAELIKYFFYKNMVFTLGQLWFAYFCAFSGTSIYNATYLVLFNTIFTGGPVIVRALLEQDMNYMQIIEEIKDEKIDDEPTEHPKRQLEQQLLHKSTIGKSSISKLSSIKTIRSLDNSDLESKLPLGESKDDRFFRSKSKIVSKLSRDQSLKRLFPMLYTHSQEELSLTPRIFILLILESVVESFGIFLCIYYGIEAPELWIMSICLYTVILALVTIRICYDITYWTWLMVFAILFTSVLPYVIFIYVMSLLQLQLAGTFVEIFKMPDFYLCLGIAVGLGSFIQATFNVVSKYYFPTAIDLVRKEWKNIKVQQAHKRNEQRKADRRINMESQYREILQNSRKMFKPGAQIEMREVQRWKNT